MLVDVTPYLKEQAQRPIDPKNRHPAARTTCRERTTAPIRTVGRMTNRGHAASACAITGRETLPSRE